MQITTQEEQITVRSPSRGWKRLRRWGGLVLLGLFLGLSLLALYFNKVDLPTPFKDLVLAQFSKGGWDLQFSRMRLRWYRGLVIEDLRLRHLQNHNAPELLAPDAQLRISRLGVLKLELNIDSILLSQGQLTWKDDDGQPLAQATSVELKARRVRGDDWKLAMLRGNVLGLQIDLQGDITNVLDLAQWPWPSDQATAPAFDLIQFLDWVRLVQVSTNSSLSGSCWGDGRSPASFRALLQLHTPRLTTPWARLTNLTASVQLIPPATNQVHSRVRLFIAGTGGAAGKFKSDEFRLTGRTQLALTEMQLTNVQLTAQFARLHHPEASLTNLSIIAMLDPPNRLSWPMGEATAVLDSGACRWGTGQKIRSLARWTASPETKTGCSSELSLAVHNLTTPWGSSGPAHLRVEAVHEKLELWPSSIDLGLDAQAVQTPWGQSKQLSLQLDGPLEKSLLETNLPWSERLAGLPHQLQLSLAEPRTPQFEADHIELNANWQAPQLVVRTTNQLYGGTLSLISEMDTSTRWTHFEGSCDVDFQQLSSLLNPKGQGWLEKYTWETPPRLFGMGKLRLPAFTNRQPDWRADILPTLSMEGGLTIGAASYQEIPFSSATSTCTLSNMLWKLPALELTRPEGTLRARYESDLRSRSFEWVLEGAFDPCALKPLVTNPDGIEILNQLEFTSAPTVAGQLAGNWNDPDSLSFRGVVSAVNLAFRNQLVSSATTTLFYANRFITLVRPQVFRAGDEHGVAEGLGIDLVHRQVYLTNATAILDPQAVAIAIGEQSASTLKPYQFERPPRVHVEGHVDTRPSGVNTDLVFDVDGGPFRWKRCYFDQIDGQVRWIGRTLILTNVQGDFADGQIEGHAQFNFTETDEARFAFAASLSEADLRAVNRSFFAQTNNVEGVLSGTLVITNALTTDTNSWMGHGTVQLRNGLIWDIPMFGVFSPILNAFVPGLGNSRARRAVATFEVTNSVAQTSDLAIDATAMRMQYGGIVGIDGTIDGRMKAELLRNMPGVGFVLSRIFWPVTKLFEYRVSGTLQDPETEPLWIVPRILFLPFQPLKALGEAIPTPQNQKPAPPE